MIGPWPDESSIVVSGFKIQKCPKFATFMQVDIFRRIFF